MFELFFSILKMLGIVLGLGILIVIIFAVRENNKLHQSLSEEDLINGNKGAEAKESISQKWYVSWNGSYAIEVVGESYYQSNLLSISGQKKETSKFTGVIAELRHVPSNKYDLNAQAVYIEGRQVGHLSKREAHALIREKGKLNLGSHVAILVKATITGGWKNDRSEGNFGVVLDMPAIKDIAKVISDSSFEDSDLKRAKAIPLNREQRRFFDYLGIKRDESINSLNVEQQIADKKIEIRSSEDRELKEKLMTYQKREMVILDLLEDWRDRENGVISLYDEIRMPSELQVLKTLEELESEGISWNEIKSNNEMFYNKLLEKYPKLKK